MGGCHSGRQVDKDFNLQVVKAHNAYRSKHKTPSLKYSSKLSAHAQKWADELAKTGQFKHSDCNYKKGKVGENLASRFSSDSSSEYTGQMATDQWYNEIQYYTFGVDQPATNKAGHFTQLLWKGSKQIGVGKGVCSNGKVVVVANYKPAGNVRGKYKQHVLAPKK